MARAQSVLNKDRVFCCPLPCRRLGAGQEGVFVQRGGVGGVDMLKGIKTGQVQLSEDGRDRTLCRKVQGPGFNL